MARSLVEESEKLPPNANLITYNVTNLTVCLYYSLEGNGKNTTKSGPNVTSTLASPGDNFAVATVSLTSGDVSVRVAHFKELPEWVQNVVRELRG